MFLNPNKILASLLAGLWLPFAAEAELPNIVYILADDLGWNDVGFHGSEIQTTRIDKLATESVRLERFYVSPICSPTRAGLLTGRYPIRFGLQNHVISPVVRNGLPPEELTLPEMLAEVGYSHRAAFGKWHLGLASTKFHPNRHGFTSFYGHYNGAIDYFSRKRGGQLDWHRGEQPVHEDGYATDLLGEAVVTYILATPQDEPFFAYVAFNAPHSPIQAKPEDLALYQYDPNGPRAPNTDAGIAKREKAPRYGDSGKGNTIRQTFAAMTTAMDRQIGAILDALDRKGIVENTIVIFHSDNGGDPTHGGDNQPLRGNKFTSFEGGARVVSMIRWPKELEGGRSIQAMLGYVDWWPTLANIVGYKRKPSDPILDGIDLLPILKGKAPPLDRAFFLDLDTVATQRFKLKGDVLFDLAKDPFETTDVAAQRPEEVARLKAARLAFHQIEGPQSLTQLPQPEQWPPFEWKLPEEDLNP